MSGSDAAVLTIGHSTHPIGAFVELLQRHGVTALADVRAAPYSRFNPQFNRETLAASLDPHGIAYVFLGRELGGRSEDPACYDDGRISYPRLGATRAFRNGLERVEQGAARHRIALMCAEKEPLECHRGLLIAPALETRGAAVAHILPEGGLELHADTVRRLLVLHGLQDAVEDGWLFPRSRAERIAEALARQARRFGHRGETRAADSAASGLRGGELHP